MGKERVYSCAKEIAMRLKEYRKYGKASLMVGAGFSKNAISKGTKIPSHQIGMNLQIECTVSYILSFLTWMKSRRKHGKSREP